MPKHIRALLIAIALYLAAIAAVAVHGVTLYSLNQGDIKMNLFSTPGAIYATGVAILAGAFVVVGIDFHRTARRLKALNQ